MVEVHTNELQMHIICRQGRCSHRNPALKEMQNSRIMITRKKKKKSRNVSSTLIVAGEDVFLLSCKSFCLHVLTQSCSNPEAQLLFCNGYCEILINPSLSQGYMQYITSL